MGKVITVIVVILVLVVVLLLVTQKLNQVPVLNKLIPQTAQNTNDIPTGSITPQNADQVLGQTDAALQNDMTQMDKDLQAIDQSMQSSDTPDSNAVNNL